MQIIMPIYFKTISSFFNFIKNFWFITNFYKSNQLLFLIFFQFQLKKSSLNFNLIQQNANRKTFQRNNFLGPKMY